MSHSLCKDNKKLVPDSWYRPENTYAARDATLTCWQCPVRLQCLELACERREGSGIWGGIPASERELLNHDYLRLSYHPNVYHRDRIKQGYSKFSRRHLKEWIPREEITDDVA
jgi:hypothetical protein